MNCLRQPIIILGIVGRIKSYNAFIALVGFAIHRERLPFRWILLIHVSDPMAYAFLTNCTRFEHLPKLKFLVEIWKLKRSNTFVFEHLPKLKFLVEVWKLRRSNTFVGLSLDKRNNVRWFITRCALSANPSSTSNYFLIWLKITIG